MDDLFVEDSFCSWHTCIEENYITRIKTENILKDFNLNNVNSDVESIKEFEKIEEQSHTINKIKGSNNDNNGLLKTSTSENIIKNEEKLSSFLPSFLISKFFNSNEQTQQNTSLADKNTPSNNVKVVKTTQEKISNALKVPNISTMNKTSSTTLADYQMEGNDYVITMPGGDLSIFEEGPSMKSEKNQLMNAKTNIEDNINDKKENIKESLKVTESHLKDDIKETKESIKNARDDFKENLNDKKEDLKSQLKESLNNKKESIKANIIDTKGDLKDTKNELKESIKDAKENITEGISNAKENSTETIEKTNEDNSNKSNNTGTIGRIFSYFKGFGKSQEHLEENDTKMTIEDEDQKIHTNMTNDLQKLNIPTVLNTESSTTTIIGDNEDYIDVKKDKKEDVDDENFVKTYEGTDEIKENSGNAVKDNIKNNTIKNNIDSTINDDNNKTINSVVSNNVINTNNSNDNSTIVVNSTSNDSNNKNTNIDNSTTNQDVCNNNEINTIITNTIDDKVSQLNENNNDIDSQQEVVLEEMTIVQNPNGTQAETKKVTTFINENQKDYNEQLQAIATNSKVDAPIKDETIIKEKIEKIEEENNQPIQTIINDNSHDNGNINIDKSNIVELKEHEDQTKIVNRPINMDVSNSSNTIVPKIHTQTESNGKENEKDYDNVSISSVGSDKFSDALTSSQININLKDNLQNSEVLNPIALHNGEDTVIIKHSELTKKSSVPSVNAKPINDVELVLTSKVLNDDNQNEVVNDTAIINNGTQNEVVNNSTITNNGTQNEVVNDTAIINNCTQNEVVNDAAIINNYTQNEVINGNTVNNNNINNSNNSNNNIKDEVVNASTINNNVIQNEVVNDNTITRPKKSSKKKHKKRKWYKKIFRMAICKGGDDYY